MNFLINSLLILVLVGVLESRKLGFDVLLSLIVLFLSNRVKHPKFFDFVNVLLHEIFMAFVNSSKLVR